MKNKDSSLNFENGNRIQLCKQIFSKEVHSKNNFKVGKLSKIIFLNK